MTTTNPAIAETAGNEADVCAAYREGCRRICERMLSDMKRLKAYIVGNEVLHELQDEVFRKSVESVVSAEEKILRVANFAKMARAS